ncbi:MAG TPA: serine hydrolase [Solirubrobacterales bacterium]
MPRLTKLSVVMALVLWGMLLGVGCGGDSDTTSSQDNSVSVELPSKGMSSSDAGAVESAAAKPVQALTEQGSAVYFGVWDPKKGSFEKAYGKAAKDGPAATTDDFFQIGSITKTFTATVVLQLIGEGKLALGETVAEADPALAKEFKPLADLTIEEPLSMHSGIPDFLNVPNGIVKDVAEEPQKVWKAEELIAGALKGKVEKPGSGGYSTTNYIGLQLIVEEATGEGLEELIASRLAEPLGIANTVLPAPDDTALPSPGTNGYINEFGVLEFEEDGAEVKAGMDVTDWSLSSAQGGGAMHTTLHELGVWGASMFGNDLLEKEQGAKRLKTTAIPGAGQYGLGIQRFGDWYGHDGETYGWEALVLHDPKSGVTAVMATNSASGATLAFAALVSALYPRSPVKLG